MLEDSLYGNAHPLFYEPIDRMPLGLAYVEHLRKNLLPASWRMRRWDVWLGAAPEDGSAELIPHGFKIHVSSTPRHALRTLDLVVPELVRRNIQFKIAGDPYLLNVLVSKRYGRGGGGKFMTIYPPSTEAFKELIEALYQKTRGEGLAGPYILSDRRYKDSRILYYRYGGMRSTSELTVMGTKRAVIHTPDGGTFDDERTPYFRLPPWVEDPFGGTRALEYSGDRVLKGRYRVDGVIVYSNAGGVYVATDLETGREVIIKEARPYAHYWWTETSEVDAVAILEREYRVLERLWPLRIAAEPIDLFSEWEHTFLVEGFVPGATFQQFFNHDSNIVTPYIRRPGRIERFCLYFRVLVPEVIDAVESIHRRGVILGDLSANNVLVNVEQLKVGFIDFESATLLGEGEEFAGITRGWGTAGFVNREKRESRQVLCEEDDWYSVGMLLYSAFAPVQNFFALCPEASGFILDRFVELGIPARVAQLIRELWDGRPDGARRVLAEWNQEDPLPEVVRFEGTLDLPIPGKAGAAAAARAEPDPEVEPEPEPEPEAALEAEPEAELAYA